MQDYKGVNAIEFMIFQHCELDRVNESQSFLKWVHSPPQSKADSVELMMKFGISQPNQ